MVRSDYDIYQVKPVSEKDVILPNCMAGYVILYVEIALAALNRLRSTLFYVTLNYCNPKQSYTQF